MSPYSFDSFFDKQDALFKAKAHNELLNKYNNSDRKIASDLQISAKL